MCSQDGAAFFAQRAKYASEFPAKEGGCRLVRREAWAQRRQSMNMMHPRGPGRPLIRRGRLLTAAAAAAIALAPGRAFTQALTPLRVTAVPNDDVSPFLYAQQSGLFRRAGLDVSIVQATSGAAIAAAVVSGSYDIGLISMMASITGHVRGLPFLMI